MNERAAAKHRSTMTAGVPALPPLPSYGGGGFRTEKETWIGGGGSGD